MLGTKDEIMGEKCMETYKERKKKVNRCKYQSRREINEQIWEEDESGSK